MKTLRGKTPLREIGRRTGLSYSYLAKVEAGRKVLREERARQILEKGFGLEDREIERFVLEAHLLDAGLEEKELRALVLDLSQKALPEEATRQLLMTYRRYIPLDPKQ